MNKNLLLDGESVRLEPLRAEHLEPLRACANDPALWQFTFGENPFTTSADAQAWLAQTLQTPPPHRH